MFKKLNKKVNNQFKEISKEDLKDKVNGGARRCVSIGNNFFFPSVPADQWK